jgi:excisionase family DNA binding protein
MPKRPDPLLTTAEAAARLGYTTGRVRQLARDELLKGQRIGRDWVFYESVVTAFNRPKKGRPRKEPSNG